MPTISPICSAILDSIDEPLLIVGGEELFANIAFCNLLNIEVSDRAKLSITEFWPTAEEELNSEEEITSSFILQDGHVLSVRLQLNNLPEGHKLINVIGAYNEDPSLDTLHTQRLETLGMLASGVAHDFNNVLAGIMGHITYLKAVLPAAGSHIDSLTAIEDGARKASSLTRQILDFSKLDTEERVSKIDLCQLVPQTCKLLRGAISPEFTIEYQVPDKPVYVLGSEGKLAQVIVNLVINSRDALDSGGWIRINLETIKDPKAVGKAFAGKELSSKSYLVLKVADNGKGMSEEVQNQVFEPYFSTKRDKGTGLGLSTVNTIVKLYGGAIEFQSELKKGTTVCVYLPEIEASITDSSAIESDATSGTLQGGTERILVVDDEYPVRNVLSVSLEHLGYKVDAASSGPEAIKRYAEAEQAYDLIILDMLMPELTGDEVYFELIRYNPDIKALLISGYSSEDAVQRVLAEGRSRFLQKPFTIEELSREVRAAIDGKE